MSEISLKLITMAPHVDILGASLMAKVEERSFDLFGTEPGKREVQIKRLVGSVDSDEKKSLRDVIIERTEDLSRLEELKTVR